MSVGPSAGARSSAIRCRAIAPSDIDAVVDLLTRGFPARTAAYWRAGLARMADRPLPDACPRFGYVLVVDDRIVGVLLTILSPARDVGSHDMWCNLSSWYVEPKFRPYATLLDRTVMGRPQTNFVNISPVSHTVQIHEARGFRRVGAGQIVAMPALAPVKPDSVVREVHAGDDVDDLPESEGRILRDHAAFGCIALVCGDAHGSEPFVFARHPIEKLQRRMGISPVHYGLLIYLRSSAALPRFAPAIGRHLLTRHGLAVMVADADGPVPGIRGRFFPGWGPRLARGRDALRPGDLAYSEIALFGP